MENNGEVVQQICIELSLSIDDIEKLINGDMNIFAKGREGCGGSDRCEVCVDLLSESGLKSKNMQVRDGDILPAKIIANYIGNGERYLHFRP